LQEFFSQS